MSSLKNINKANQRVHRERSQPESRRHLGPLEKKKDYKLRAIDYQEKRDKLKYLHRKALERNPDEFYFHMINSKTQDGVHYEKEKKPDEDSMVQKQLMQNQALKYITFKWNVERKKIEKLKANLHFLDVGGKPPNTHTIFVDTLEQAINFDPAKHLNTHPALIDRVYNRPRLDRLLAKPFPGAVDKLSVNKANAERKKMYAELLKRMEREKELRIALQKLQLRQQLANSKREKPKKVKRGTSLKAPIYKWPQRRQK